MLKETDLWIDWTCEGALADLLDKVAAHGVPPELGAQFVSRLEAILPGDVEEHLREELQELQEYVHELESMIEEAGRDEAPKE